ncbi:uncharacterized protein C17orf80 homolog isoform X2 [Tyto alba]|uniref:uncharacterized protein C17orf80 homolog isoform X2 n=1 Tax=Tyto alba TaxID=56313 RepID=UPI001C674F1B|nr:uncharacterized protein C17orf80 homolog isoform X2 [Tyto alba]
MAAPPPERELCPHCRRPFKRLRAHLPHCKAAPTPAPGLNPSLGAAAGPGSKPRAAAAGKSSKRPPSPGPASREAAAGSGKAAAGRAGSAGSSLPPQPGPQRKVEPAVRDVAEALDLLPEEVQDLPEKLSNGVKIVIEKHRARVIREKSGSRSREASMGSPSAQWAPVEGSGPGRGAGHTASHATIAQPDPQEGITPTKNTNTETHGLGAVESASARPEGEKSSSLKATKPHVFQDTPEAACRSSPGDLVQQEVRDKTVTKEKQMYLEAGVEYKAPLSALHTKSLHLSMGEGFRGHSKETSKNDLTSIQKLRESKKQMAIGSEPILNARTDIELAEHQFLLHTSKSQPICLSQASGRSPPVGAVGLEWFPDLHPNYNGLSIFPGKPFQESVGMTVKTPKSSFSEGQQAWSSYYDKYINIRKGGPAGISMLLTGYCLLSYGWSYQHIKHHRWRKYH